MLPWKKPAMLLALLPVLPTLSLRILFDRGESSCAEARGAAQSR
jgi:hypothetical protein